MCVAYRKISISLARKSLARSSNARKSTDGKQWRKFAKFTESFHVLRWTPSFSIGKAVSFDWYSRPPQVCSLPQHQRRRKCTPAGGYKVETIAFYEGNVSGISERNELVVLHNTCVSVSGFIIHSFLKPPCAFLNSCSLNAPHLFTAPRAYD